MRSYIVAAFVLLMLTNMPALGQGRDRSIKSPECPYRDEEVVLEISGLRIGDREVSFDETFKADDDWLARLVFRVTNRGQKPIAAIVIIMGLLERVDEELPTYASYDYGLQFVRMNAVTTKRARSKLGTLVQPGKEVEITSDGARPYGLRYTDELLQGTARKNNRAELATKSGARFHSADLMSANVWFTDGTNESAKLLVRTKCDRKK